MAFNYHMDGMPLAATTVTPKASPSIPDKRFIQDRKRQQEERNARIAYTRTVYGGGESSYLAHKAIIRITKPSLNQLS